MSRYVFVNTQLLAASGDIEEICRTHPDFLTFHFVPTCYGGEGPLKISYALYVFLTDGSSRVVFANTVPELLEKLDHRIKNFSFPPTLKDLAA